MRKKKQETKGPAQEEEMNEPGQRDVTNSCLEGIKTP